MKKMILLTLLLSLTALAQENRSPRIVLITLDGFRWQELFTGADSLLVGNPAYVADTLGLKSTFWKASPEARREALLPFIWKEASEMGQLYGNRNYGNQVDLTNTLWFSYPGYNEILTGKADDARISSNDKIPNPNITILELAQQSDRYRDRVAAFGSWDVFPFIINEPRSGVPVNAGFDVAEGNGLSDREHFLNRLQPQVPSPWGSVRLDAFTHHYALEFMRRAHPELIYIAYGETDDFAHDGDYEAYLKAARNTDGLIRELWEYTQADPFYKDQTVFIVTTDHGRGTIPLESWRSHGEEVAGAGQVWMLFFGNGVLPTGEHTSAAQRYTAELAPLILGLLNLNNPDGMPSQPFPDVME